jgi:hypothetical protein
MQADFQARSLHARITSMVVAVLDKSNAVPMSTPESKFFRRRSNSAQNFVIKSPVPEKGCVMALSVRPSVNFNRVHMAFLLTSEATLRICLNEITTFDGLLQDLICDILKDNVLLQFVCQSHQCICVLHRPDKI